MGDVDEAAEAEAIQQRVAEAASRKASAAQIEENAAAAIAP